jgi:hypothetical protein
MKGKTEKRPASNKGSTGAKVPSAKKKKAEPIKFNFSPINYEELRKVPLIDLEIRYAYAKSTDLPIKESLPMDTLFYKVVQIINEKHNGALKNIKLYPTREDCLLSKE